MAAGPSILSASLSVPRCCLHGASSCALGADGAMAAGGLAPLELRLQRHQGGEAAGAEAERMGLGRPVVRPMTPRQERSTAVDCSCGAFLLRAHVMRLALAGAKERKKRRLRPSAALAVESASARGAASLELAFAAGVEVIPHPKKVEKGGEDAYFISTFGGGILGVADGVSGWAEENVDPALFSKEFMAHAAKFVASGMIGKDPRVLLQMAHQATKSKGAATACVAILERRGTLHIGNLGDCGLRVIRKGRIVFATAPQQHYFDCPYQFSTEPGAQSASDAAVFKLPVVEGDTIVLGSDGLFDNVYNRDIEHIIKSTDVRNQESAQRCAHALAALASRHSKDDKYESPYTREAISQGYDVSLWKRILGQKLTGGKLDDITVLVAHVVDARTLEPPESPLLPPDSPISLDDSFELSMAFSGSSGGTNNSFSLDSSMGSVSTDSPRKSSISVDSPGIEEVSSGPPTAMDVT